MRRWLRAALWSAGSYLERDHGVPRTVWISRRYRNRPRLLSSPDSGRRSTIYSARGLGLSREDLWRQQQRCCPKGCGCVTGLVHALIPSFAYRCCRRKALHVQCKGHQNDCMPVWTSAVHWTLIAGGCRRASGYADRWCYATQELVIEEALRNGMRQGEPTGCASGTRTSTTPDPEDSR